TIPFGLLAIAIAIYFLPFVFTLRRATAWGIVLAGFIFLAGASGLEFVISRLFLDEPKEFGYAALMALKQGLVMLGAIVTIHVLLGHMRATAGTTNVEVEAEQRAT